MDLLDTIMKDVVMADVYESAAPMVLLDLRPISQPLQRIEELTALDFDRSVFLSGMLEFNANKYTSNREASNFLQEHLLKINQEYRDFSIQLRKEKMKALAAMMTQFREMNMELHQLLNYYNLYNASGILRIDSIDASDMSCAIARMENRKWTQDFNPRATYSTSGTSLAYLGQILLSA